MWRGPGRGGPGSALADSVLARTGTGAARDRGQGFRDQLAWAGTGLRNASPAQHDPPQFDFRQPTSHNAT